jgi:hypothetical protein
MTLTMLRGSFSKTVEHLPDGSGQDLIEQAFVVASAVQEPQRVFEQG